MPVTKITDQQGNVVKNYHADCNQVMPETTADEVNDILRGVQEPGGFGYYNHLNLAPAVRRQDRHDRLQQVSLVHRLHPEPGRQRR